MLQMEETASIYEGSCEYIYYAAWTDNMGWCSSLGLGLTTPRHKG